MSNYTKTTNFGAKDTLPSGDSQKIIRGTEFDTEFNAISTAIATKLEVDGSNNLAISGTFSATKLIPTGGSATGNGMYLPAANAVAISTNGTERLRIDSSGVASFASNPILSGGTANGLVYLDGSKVTTSGSAVTFDGTNFATTGTASATKLIPTGGSATGNGLYLPAANTVALSTNGTERLRVDSSGNLGVGTASPNTYGKLAVVGDGGTINLIAATNTTTTSVQHRLFNSSGTSVFRVIYYGASYASGSFFNIGANGTVLAQEANAPLGIGTIGVEQPLIFGTNSVERARIDSSGNLGIGTSSPISKINAVGAIRSSDSSTETNAIQMSASASAGTIETRYGTPLVFGTNATERMRLDASGTLGIGVTPSAWSGGFKATQYPGGSVASYASGTNLQIEVGNAYYQSSLGTYTYYNTGTAPTLYRQISGEHRWLTASSGTAGNAITFTQAMTLDASGNLGIGVTSPVAILHTKSSVGAVAIETTQSRGSNNTFVTFRDPTGEAGYIGYGASNSDFYTWNVLSGSVLFGTGNTERMRLKSTGQLRFVPLASDPSGAEAGDVYYNSTSNKLKVYNGTAWADLH